MQHKHLLRPALNYKCDDKRQIMDPSARISPVYSLLPVNLEPASPPASHYIVVRKIFQDRNARQGDEPAHILVLQLCFFAERDHVPKHSATWCFLRNLNPKGGGRRDKNVFTVHREERVRVRWTRAKKCGGGWDVVESPEQNKKDVFKRRWHVRAVISGVRLL